MTTPEDRELEALLREQALLPVPLALVGRILDEVLPREEPVRPWVLVGRTAAAVLVFCASWLALSGDVPAFADVTPERHVAAALPAELPVATTAEVLEAATPAEVGGGPVLWLAVGVLLLLAGVWVGLRTHGLAAKGGAA